MSLAVEILSELKALRNAIEKQDPDKLWARDEFASEMGVSVRALDRWKAAGMRHLPTPLRFSKRWAYDFFQSQSVTGNLLPMKKRAA